MTWLTMAALGAFAALVATDAVIDTLRFYAREVRDEHATRQVEAAQSASRHPRPTTQHTGSPGRPRTAFLCNGRRRHDRPDTGDQG